MTHCNSAVNTVHLLEVLRPGGHCIQAISPWVRLYNVRLAYWHFVALFLIASFAAIRRPGSGWLMSLKSSAFQVPLVRWENLCKSWVAGWCAAWIEARQEGNSICSLKHPHPPSRGLIWPSAAGPVHLSLTAASPPMAAQSRAGERWHWVPEGTTVAAEMWLVSQNQSNCLFEPCLLFLPNCHCFPAMALSWDGWKCCGCIQERLVTVGTFVYL